MAYSHNAQRETRERDQRETRERLERDGESQRGDMQQLRQLVYGQTDEQKLLVPEDKRYT